MTRLLLALCLSAISLLAQYTDRYPVTIVGSGTLPATCAIGDMAFRTDTTLGQNIYICATTNVWTLYGASQTFYLNETITGTQLHKLAKLTGNPSKVIATTISDTLGIIGIVVSGSGNSGTATIVWSGIASCVFDGATTAGDYVVNSPTVAGDCHDTGSSTPPLSGQIIGIVTSTNGGTGTYSVDLSPRQLIACSSGGYLNYVLFAVFMPPTDVLQLETPTGGYTTPIIDAASGNYLGRWHSMIIKVQI